MSNMTVSEYLDIHGKKMISLEALRIYAEKIYKRRMKIITESKTGKKVIIKFPYEYDTFTASAGSIRNPKGENVTREVVAYSNNFYSPGAPEGYTIDDIWHYDEPYLNRGSTTEADLKALVKIQASL